MRTLLPLLLLALLWTPPATADDLADLAQTNRLLQAEYELAKSQKLYFIFDLPASRILFKASGIVLAEAPVLSVSSWGRPADGLTYTLVKRSARKEPERENIAIPDGKEPEKPSPPPTPVKAGETPKPPALQALELSDMPTEYTLELDDGTRLIVRAPLAADLNFKEKLRYYLDKLNWNVGRPLSSIWNRRQESMYNETLLTLPEREARMLYWSFQVDGRCLIHWP